MMWQGVESSIAQNVVIVEPNYVNTTPPPKKRGIDEADKDKSAPSVTSKNKKNNLFARRDKWVVQMKVDTLKFALVVLRITKLKFLCVLEFYLLVVLMCVVSIMSQGYYAKCPEVSVSFLCLGYYANDF